MQAGRTQRNATVTRAISTWPPARWRCAGAYWDVDKAGVELAARGE
jgi:hypothetical protein